METVERVTEARVTEAVLIALLRASRDPLRHDIREEGIDERDLAFEAGLLEPVEVEATIYGTQKRRTILGVLRRMQRRGLITMDMGPSGIYRVLPTQQGELCAANLTLPWHWKLRNWVWDRVCTSGVGDSSHS